MASSPIKEEAIFTWKGKVERYSGKQSIKPLQDCAGKARPAN
jgi:hypothetical protein